MKRTLIASLAAVVCLANIALAQSPAIAATQADPRVMEADSLFLVQDFRGAAAQYGIAEQALSLDPRSLYRYGMSSFNLGDTVKAAGLLDRAAKSGNPAMLFNAGSIHAQMGHADEAFSYVEKSITSGFSNEKIFTSDGGYGRLSADPRYAAIVKRLHDAFAPCNSQPESHQFDFWVGEWTVVGLAGQQAGTSSVQKILDECVVFENWTDAQGGHGKSLNAYNAQLHRWQQFWVDQYGGVTEYRESKWVGTSLQYLATTLDKQGNTVLQRMTFTPIDSVTVRQFGESSKDNGATWTAGYDLRYHRKH